MFRLELDVRDLAAARFVISPLHEAVGSLWPLYVAPPRREHRRWARNVRLHAGVDHELLRALVSACGWIPNFVAPPPAAARPRIAAQLAQLRATSPEKVVTDVLAAYGGSPLPACLRGLERDPAALRDRIADALGQYWRLAIEPHWPRIRTLLEADLLHRGQHLVRHGPGFAFGGLDPRIRWGEGVLEVEHRPPVAPGNARRRPRAHARAQPSRAFPAPAGGHPRPAGARLPGPRGRRPLAGTATARSGHHARAAQPGTDAPTGHARPSRLHDRTGRPARGDAQRGLAASSGARRRRAGDPGPGGSRGPLRADRRGGRRPCLTIPATGHPPADDPSRKRRYFRIMAVAAPVRDHRRKSRRVRRHDRPPARTDLRGGTSSAQCEKNNAQRRPPNPWRGTGSPMTQMTAILL